ncbi:D-alanine--D-alanine ligase family protein [Paludicola sp. MB14-C6]|uniref:D-alanine--D-alanine ligase family protein n=1 Tax=Paludihabitans sp. MB14-C6 TaxID=3070656 RepID=UPI0027DC1D70|nr:D-alanine--D-alanine ligase family protein [Paludicola sp. MB14-C6]WMJ22065.1 D-alanine--D-alanine ligase family protein [Paludicola sp. MB14-C6]
MSDNNSHSSNKLNLGIIFGGASSEYDVSLMSATSVLKNIDSEKYNIYKIGITKEGVSFLYNGEIEEIQKNNWQGAHCVPCVISPDRSHHGIIVLGDSTKIIRLDVIFPVLHGKNGEDGTFQGLMALANIPYVGCDTLSSACCMDKAVTKTIFDNAKINNAKWECVLQYQYNKDQEACFRRIEENLGYPCFVKPANAGSSVGITKATDRSSLIKAFELAFIHDKKVVIEQNIKGKEIECAVLGNEAPIASVLGEIVPCNDFYDYDAKYLANKTVTHIPARIDASVAETIKSIAIQAYLALGCEGFSRVDFFLTENNEIILNEINTIPGFTSISMYPQLFAASGIPYTKLIDRLIELALERK